MEFKSEYDKICSRIEQYKNDIVTYKDAYKTLEILRDRQTRA